MASDRVLGLTRSAFTERRALAGPAARLAEAKSKCQLASNYEEQIKFVRWLISRRQLYRGVDTNCLRQLECGRPRRPQALNPHLMPIVSTM